MTVICIKCGIVDRTGEVGPCACDLPPSALARALANEQKERAEDLQRCAEIIDKAMHSNDRVAFTLLGNLVRRLRSRNRP